MPNLDGYEVARRIQAVPRSPKPFLVAVTGGATLAARQAGYEYNCDQPFFRKTISVNNWRIFMLWEIAMGVVSEAALLRFQRMAMAVCAIGILFCWGKAATQLHEADLLFDRVASGLSALLAALPKGYETNLDLALAVEGRVPMGTLRPSYYGATIIYPRSLGGAWNVFLEGAAFECKVYRTILAPYSDSEVLLRSVRAITGRICPGVYLSLQSGSVTGLH